MIASLPARKLMAQETSDPNTPLQRLIFWYELGCNKDKILSIIPQMDKDSRAMEFSENKLSLVNKAKPKNIWQWFYKTDKQKSLNKFIQTLEATK